MVSEGFVMHSSAKAVRQHDVVDSKVNRSCKSL